MAKRTGAGRNPASDLPDPATPRKRIRVAIVGGGCAGMAAAWQLSRLPGYDVTVYEQSWRLGGKGASGRSSDGRIIEHGLHVWLGFYENAFRMIRDCYDEVSAREWGPHQKDAKERLAHGSFEDAFFPEPHIGVTGANAAGKTTVWSGFLPPEPGLPGDPITSDNNPFTLASYLLRTVNLLKTLMLSVIGTTEEAVPGRPRPEGRSGLDEFVDLNFSFDPTRSPELLIQRIAGRLRDGTLTAAAALLQAVTIVETILQDFNHSPQIAGSALNLMKAVAGQVRKQLRDFVSIDEKLRWKTEIIDIVMTIVVGLYRDRVLFGERGLDALNDLDYREWLKKHGATKTSLESRFITGIYDLVFAYDKGVRKNGKLAAGVALRGALRMFFTYRGSMFWRMRSGMGDAVFAPLYKVMTLNDRSARNRQGKPRPVKFHFLHSLKEISLATEASGKRNRFVTRLIFDTTGSAACTENPGTNALDHLGCWPDTRDHLLHDGDQSPGVKVLNLQDDFDAVIFATGLDEFRKLAEGYAEDGKRVPLPETWVRAFASGQTVATKAAQVWLNSDLEDLGWYRGSGIISALGLQFDTWADMTHTLPSERRWRRAGALADATAERADTAKSVAYFCGVLSDADVKNGDASAAALRESVSELLRSTDELWPAPFRQKARKKGDPPPPPRDSTLRAMVVAQHVQANTTGSDRYSLSLPGSIAGRLSPLDRSVVNMTVAGDWTACGLDAGCVEAAVMSGMLAAHAITGATPRLEDIVGYDHP